MCIICDSYNLEVLCDGCYTLIEAVMSKEKCSSKGDAFGILLSLEMFSKIEDSILMKNEEYLAGIAWDLCPPDEE